MRGGIVVESNLIEILRNWTRNVQLDPFVIEKVIMITNETNHDQNPITKGFGKKNQIKKSLQNLFVLVIDF